MFRCPCLSLFSTHPVLLYLSHFEKSADMVSLSPCSGPPITQQHGTLEGRRAGSLPHHLPGLRRVPRVPPDPQRVALDGGDLLVAPVFVFPPPAVGPAMHPT